MEFSGKLSRVGLSLIGIIIIILSTRWGIGLSPDSITYIGGARNLADGRGFSIANAVSPAAPITQFAPLYSALLSITGVFRIDPLDGARWVNAILFGANIFLVCALIGKNLTGKSPLTKLWLPILGGWLFLASPTLLEIHMMAWSEALFLLLGLSGLYLLAIYLEIGKRKAFAGAVALTALAMLTRYAGLIFGVTGALGIILFLHKPWRFKILAATLFGFLSIVPLGLWLVRNRLIAGTTTNRELLFHPIDKAHFSEAISTLGSWFLISETARTWVKILPFIIIGILLLIAARSIVKSGANIPIFVKVLGIFIVFYFLFLAVTISFIDANTPLNGRILSPVYASGYILVIVLLGNVPAKYLEHGLSKSFVLGVMVLLAVAYLPQDKNQVVAAYQNGLGFNNIYWYRSETIEMLSALPPGIPIYSNAPEAIYFHANRPASRLPSKYQSSERRANPEYTAMLAQMKAILQAKQGVIVYFNALDRASIPEPDELIQEVGVHLVQQANDGAIYGFQSSK